MGGVARTLVTLGFRKPVFIPLVRMKMGTARLSVSESVFSDPSPLLS